MPVTLEAAAFRHCEPAKQAPIFSPLLAFPLQQSVTVAQFLGKLPVAMPGAMWTVELAVHFPRFGVDSATAIIKPFYATLWHGSQIHFSAGLGLLLAPGISTTFQPQTSFKDFWSVTQSQQQFKSGFAQKNGPGQDSGGRREEVGMENPARKTSHRPNQSNVLFNSMIWVNDFAILGELI